MRGLYRYKQALFLSKFATREQVRYNDVTGVILDIRAYKIEGGARLSYLYKVQFPGATLEIPETYLERVPKGEKTPAVKLYKIPPRKDRFAYLLVGSAALFYLALVGLSFII